MSVLCPAFWSDSLPNESPCPQDLCFIFIISVWNAFLHRWTFSNELTIHHIRKSSNHIWPINAHACTCFTKKKSPLWPIFCFLNLYLKYTPYIFSISSWQQLHDYYIYMHFASFTRGHTKACPGLCTQHGTTEKHLLETTMLMYVNELLGGECHFSSCEEIHMADFFTPCSCYDLRSEFYVQYLKYRVVTNKCIFEEKCLCVWACVCVWCVFVCVCVCSKNNR